MKWTTLQTDVLKSDWKCHLRTYKKEIYDWGKTVQVTTDVFNYSISKMDYISLDAHIYQLIHKEPVTGFIEEYKGPAKETENTSVITSTELWCAFWQGRKSVREIAWLKRREYSSLASAPVLYEDGPLSFLSLISFSVSFSPLLVFALRAHAPVHWHYCSPTAKKVIH